MQNLPQSAVANVGGKIFTFGSYRLGVHTKGKFSYFVAFVISNSRKSFKDQALPFYLLSVLSTEQNVHINPFAYQSLSFLQVLI